MLWLIHRTTRMEKRSCAENTWSNKENSSAVRTGLFFQFFCMKFYRLKCREVRESSFSRKFWFIQKCYWKWKLVKLPVSYVCSDVPRYDSIYTKPPDKLLNWLIRFVELITACDERLQYFRATRCNSSYFLTVESCSLYRIAEFFWSATFVDWIVIAGIYLFKVNNENTRNIREICSKLKIKTLERRQWLHSGVFIDNLE